METDKKMLVSKGDLIFWILTFTAMGFFVGMFVSSGFGLHRISAKIEAADAKIEAADAKIKEYEREQENIEELMRKIYEESK